MVKTLYLSSLGGVHKLRNAVGVDGWSAKVLLLHSLERNLINKMTTKTLLYRWVGGQKITKVRYVICEWPLGSIKHFLCYDSTLL